MTDEAPKGQSRPAPVDADAPVSSIRNLGPAAEAAFARAGIHSAGQLRRLGADEAYRRLLESGARPHFIGYYVLVMGLQGRPWNDCSAQEKRDLRRRFDQIKAGLSPDPEKRNEKDRLRLETVLNQIGLIPKA
ncbi:TfoX-like protein [Albidovulum inexpectatum]|uniref:TfoX-like protein n=1 Tax=Albidovulum inexpectatum TaxID=196587 RepID=A0A2S5JJQ9_9RHOB|nr:TfoX/Sxy family DNA transformation protein [Albidovulum inexpectatum]PPB81608.1 TfoX-like protein [Albidovulum inexpectatum]